jgi:hypothetical protein
MYCTIINATFRCIHSTHLRIIEYQEKKLINLEPLRSLSDIKTKFYSEKRATFCLF